VETFIYFLSNDSDVLIFLKASSDPTVLRTATYLSHSLPPSPSSRERQSGVLPTSSSMGIAEKIKEIEDEMARTQKNKATNGHLGILKARIAKLRSQMLEDGSGSGGGGGDGFAVQRSGDGRVALIGFPSVGKSSLLSEMTETKSEAAAYEFTTLTCIPGNLVYNGTRVQLLDLPGIIEGASQGKGRGKEVIAVARTADLIMIVLDAGKEQVNRHREILEGELETVGIRLNKAPPNVTVTQKKTGGVRINSTCALTKLGEDPERTARQVLSECVLCFQSSPGRSPRPAPFFRVNDLSCPPLALHFVVVLMQRFLLWLFFYRYKMHHVDLLFREDIGVDELIDVIQGNRKYVRCLYVYNKVDMVTIEDIDQLARQPDSIVISIHLKLNLDYFLEKMWEYMGLIRVYTKRKGAPPDLDDPVVLSMQRDGITVEAATAAVSRDLLTIFNFAYVWGTSPKHSPQRVGMGHVLEDEDVIQIVTKTVKQDAKSKGYSDRVQAYNSMVAEKRKARTKAGKKKRSSG
jgi:small GTP-binding protein